MPIFVRDRGFYRNLFAIALPIALQNLISFGVSMLDSIMLGALGDVPLSASSLANQPTFVFSVLVFGLSSGSTVLTSQYWGKRDLDAIQLIFGMAIKVTVVVSVLFSAAMFCFPEFLMRVFTDEEPVVAAGIEYMRLIAGANLLMGLSSILCMLFRSIEVVKVALISSIVSLFTNAGFNYVFIFGAPALGIPAMGIVGAGIATVIARVAEFLIVVIYVFRFEKTLKLRFSKLMPNNRLLWRDFIRYSTPVAINELMWSLGTALQAIVIGRLGMEMVSANSIAGMVNQLATIFIWGIANASAVIIGKSIGGGEPERAQRYAKTLQAICVITGFFAAGLVLLTKDFVIGCYNVSDAAKEYAGQLMLVTAVLVFVVCYTAPVLVGILRGGGDIKFVMYMDIVCLWLITTPLGFITAFVFKWDPWVVWALMKIDEPIKAVVAFLRLRGTKWIRNVTRDITASDQPQTTEVNAE